MDEQKKIHDTDAQSIQPEELAEPDLVAEEAFRAEREKRIEGFVLNISEDELADDPVLPEQKPEPEPAPVAPKRVERPLVRRKKNSWMYSTIYLCVILAIGVVLGNFVASGIRDLLGASRDETEVTITIDPDMTDGDIIRHLEEVGAIREPFFFTLYAKVTGATYKPGTYVIKGNADYELINNSLRGTANRIDTVKVTFIEGWTLQQFAKALEEHQVCDADEFLEAVNEEDFTNYKFIKAIPNPKERAYVLEGYLFPDTYEFYKYSTPKTVIRKILNNVNSYVITREVYDKAEALGMTVDEVLILASMIQKEVNNTTDMKMVSSVFHNRLKNWGATGKLQSDPTSYYEQTLGEEYKGLYDTYVCNGLPVGPISNPGRQAIQAALNPTKSSNYYFVADVNGKTYYAKTLAEHNKNIAYVNTVKPNTPGDTSVPTEGD
ncbi:MAG: endolytic transglycosylase MltG [Clostridia bacterium]|nr:endolytic transglycosylase MltG [Clostridia bacterium]